MFQALLLTSVFLLSHASHDAQLKTPGAAVPQQRNPTTSSYNNGYTEVKTGSAPNVFPKDFSVELKEQKEPESRFHKLTDFAGVFSLLGAFLAAVVSVLCFVGLPIRQKRLETRLAFVEKQLQELYGPLLAECIHADSVFRKTELVLNDRSQRSPHEFVNIDTDLIRKLRHSQSDYHPLMKEISAWALLTIYLQSNKVRFDLIKRNLHLFGPYPPLSLFLFLTHSTQVKALIDLKEQMEIPSTVTQPEKDPYAIYPFPVILGAETIAKVAFLKALQREYQYQIGGFTRTRQIFFRDAYFLVLQLPPDVLKSCPHCCMKCQEAFDFLAGNRRDIPDLRDKLNSLSEHKIYLPQSFPFIWGPYTGVELLEMRSWIIGKESVVRRMGKNMAESQTIYLAFLHSAVVTIAKEKSVKDVFRLPLHYRVGQSFDSIDRSSGKSLEWTEDFHYSTLSANDQNLEAAFHFFKRDDTRCITTLKDLTQTIGFAYREEYDRISK